MCHIHYGYVNAIFLWFCKWVDYTLYCSAKKNLKTVTDELREKNPQLADTLLRIFGDDSITQEALKTAQAIATISDLIKTQFNSELTASKDLFKVLSVDSLQLADGISASVQMEKNRLSILLIVEAFIYSL